VPVLTLGPHLRRPTRDNPPTNILVAADFTPSSARAARYAAMLARENKAKLTLLHVVNRKQIDCARTPRPSGAESNCACRICWDPKATLSITRSVSKLALLSQLS